MTFAHINTSIQVGDSVYYVPTLTSGTQTSAMNFNEGMHSNIIKFGSVLNINRSTGQIEIIWDNDSVPSPPNLETFILFSKNKEVNTSSLLGYYANIGFENDSNEEIELFAVSSEIAESSK
jgi:hypothetical protein